MEDKNIFELYKQLSDRHNLLSERVLTLEIQQKRLDSHVESEVGLARRDIVRLDVKLFGENEEDFYGGRIGQLFKNQQEFRLEMTKLIAKSIGFITALSLIIQYAFQLYLSKKP